MAETAEPWEPGEPAPAAGRNGLVEDGGAARAQSRDAQAGAPPTSYMPNAARSSDAIGERRTPSPSHATDDVHWYQSSGRPGELAWLAEGFARSFSAAAGGLLRADVTTRLAAVAETSRRQFSQAVEEPTCAFGLIPVGALPADPDAVNCLEFSPAIAMALVERLMGGGGDGPAGASGQRAAALTGQYVSVQASPPPQRPLTAAERRVLLHLANLVALSLSAARPGGKSGELRADLAPVGGCPDDRVVVATFELSLSGLVGTMRLCGCGRLAGAARGGAGKRATAAPLEVSASIEGLELESAELDALAAGDILATDVPTDGEITIRIGGIPKYAARLRVIDGRKVVTITRRLAPRGQ